MRDSRSAQLHDWLSVARDSYLTEESTWHAAPRALSVARLAQQPPLLQEELVHTLVRRAGADGAAALSYASLRHALAQLEHGSASWSLDVTRDCRLKRAGDTLTAEAVGAPRKRD